MKSILKKTSSDSITFEDVINEQIRIMQNSADEYNKFLKLLDNLVPRIDLTMDSTRPAAIKKTVHFSEHNKIFLIPPQKFNIQELFFLQTSTLTTHSLLSIMLPSQTNDSQTNDKELAFSANKASLFSTHSMDI